MRPSSTARTCGRSARVNRPSGATATAPPGRRSNRVMPRYAGIASRRIHHVRRTTHVLAALARRLVFAAGRDRPGSPAELAGAGLAAAVPVSVF